MSRSATPATQNDMTTSCDTSKKTRLRDFSHRHGDFHNSQRENQRFPTSFLVDLLQNRGFVKGFHRFSCHVTKCHTCHGICTLSPLRAALTIRFAKTCNTTRPKCCACHANWNRRCPKCCACHEKCNTSFEHVAKVLRLPHKTAFWRVVKHVGMSQSATPATQNDMTTSSDTSKKSIPIVTGTLRPRQSQTDGWGRLQTVANGCGRLRMVADARSRVTRTRLNPQSPKCKTRTLCYEFGKNTLKIKKQKMD